jgi:hypothetical protein
MNRMTPNQRVQARIQTAVRRLRTNSVYLGEEVHQTQKGIRWLETDDATSIVVRRSALARLSVNSHEDFEDPNWDQSPAELSLIALLTHDDFWLTSDGGWNGPTREFPALEDVKITCTAGSPLQDSLRLPFTTALQNIDALITRSHSPTYALETFRRTSALTLERKLVFRHKLFEVRKSRYSSFFT